MSIMVEVTEKNLCIFHKLCELDKEFQKATDVEEEDLIVKKALELCEQIEMVV